MLRPLGRDRKLRITLLAFAAIALIAAARFSAQWISPVASSILRDWLPAALLLVPYWQVGQFFSTPDPKMQTRLARFDRTFYRQLGIEPAQTRISLSLATFLELGYLMVYPLVPLGIVVLYVTGMRSMVDLYWLAVLSATYTCFAITLFVRALPPRSLSGSDRFQIPWTRVRTLNRGILDSASIHAITCPSAHVASSLAAGLVLLRFQPWVGGIFLFIALSIIVATIVGGYHYVADVLLATIIATLMFAVSFCIY
jgi:membrane-associated phospholipid phosphatase